MRTLPCDDRHTPLFTMGQAAGMLGLRPAFLRRLDHLGIVSPARSAGGQRRYSCADLDTAGQVIDLIGEGLTLPGAQRVLHLQREIDALRRQLDALHQRPPAEARRPA